MGEVDEANQDARDFLLRPDEAILQFERPRSKPAPMVQTGDGKEEGSYMLSRFLNTSPTSDTQSPPNSTRMLRSMQHFFLQLGIIQSAFQFFRAELIEASGSDGYLLIDSEGLQRALTSIDVPFRAEDCESLIAHCSKQLKALQQSTALESHSAAVVTYETDTGPIAVTWPELVTSIPLWDLVMVSCGLV